ncbi:MAG: lysophospholipid acyltransferase family protein [Anaerolineales bacterium]
MFDRALTLLFQFAMKLVARQEFEGLERIPDPPYILAVNHLGFFDVVFVYGRLGSAELTGWAAEKYEYHPLFGPLLRAGGAIFIERGRVDRKAIEAAVQWLHQGNGFGIAPEGTRSPTSQLQRAKTGVAYLADEAKVPVMPIAITGTEKIGRGVPPFYRPKTTARIGEPFMLPPLPEQERAAGLRHNTDEIMCRIAAMLPPEYRGVYGDHPRTLELLGAGYHQEPINANAPQD